MKKKTLPCIKTLNKIESIRDQIKSLYEILDKESEKALERFGTGDFYFDNNGTYKKLSIVDNIKLLKSGKLFKINSIKKIDVNVKILKNKPKELK